MYDELSHEDKHSKACDAPDYRKTLDRSPRLLSVQTVLTPGLYMGTQHLCGTQLLSKHFEVRNFLWLMR